MSYRFRRKESIREAVERIVDEQARRVVEHLSAPTDHSMHIHAARQGLKRLRGLLRLIRPALPRSTYHAANQICRDAARSVAGRRDAAVVLDTFDDLTTELLPLEAGAVGEVRNRLAAALQRSREPDAADDARSYFPELLSLANHLGTAGLPQRDWRPLKRGFRRCYRQGQAAMRMALAHPRDDLYHEWRKRVKDRWYQVLLLRNCWKPIMLSLGDELKRLADLLGSDHDLAVLRRTLEEDLSEDLSPGLLSMLTDRIHDRQSALRREARRLGQCLYAEKAKRTARRLETYWRTWKRGRSRKNKPVALDYSI